MTQENLPSEATPASYPETGNPPVTEAVEDVTPVAFVDVEDQDPDDGTGAGE